MKIQFSVNDYDSDGDLVDECIHLHFDDILILRIDRNGIGDLIEKLQSIKNEIEENYPPA
jgi:hypothetical protein